MYEYYTVVLQLHMQGIHITFRSSDSSESGVIRNINLVYRRFYIFNKSLIYLHMSKVYFSDSGKLLF